MSNKPMDVEAPVLGAILFKADDCEYAFENLRPEYFINKNHKEIFTTLQELHSSGIQIDLITVSEKSKHHDILMKISTEVFSSSSIKSHVDILLDRWYLFKAREKLMDAIKWLDKPERSPTGLRIKCEDIAFFLSDRVQDKGLQHISEVAAPTMAGLEAIQEGNFPGVLSGFKTLNDHGFYFRKKTMSVIAARPGMGKSALALKLAKNCGGNVALYSLEMANEEQYERLISMRTELTNSHLRDKDVLSQFSEKIVDAAVEINKEKIWLNDSTRVTVPLIHSQCKRLSVSEGLEMLIVDYMGLIKTPDSKGMKKRNEEVGEISKGLKNIANDLNIPVIALAQLNRTCEDRKDKRPILSDLRESGDIEQDAHMVWFIYRGEVYDPTDSPGKAEILVRKNRSGPTGTEPLSYKKETTDFVDYEPADIGFDLPGQKRTIFDKPVGFDDDGFD